MKIRSLWFTLSAVGAMSLAAACGGGSKTAEGGAAASGVDGDGEQAHGDALAGRQQHVELARLGGGGHLVRHGEQLIGAVAHKRNFPDQRSQPLNAVDHRNGGGPIALMDVGKNLVELS